MATTTAGKPETARTSKRGFPHRCPLCGAEDTLKISLADTAALECGECGEEIDLETIRDIIARWQAALAWLETAPARLD
jgi:uncharacterized protein (DUF983 family)